MEHPTHIMTSSFFSQHFHRTISGVPTKTEPLGTLLEIPTTIGRPKHYNLVNASNFPRPTHPQVMKIFNPCHIPPSRHILSSLHRRLLLGWSCGFYPFPWLPLAVRLIEARPRKQHSHHKTNRCVEHSLSATQDLQSSKNVILRTRSRELQLLFTCTHNLQMDGKPHLYCKSIRSSIPSLWCHWHMKV